MIVERQLDIKKLEEKHGRIMDSIALSGRILENKKKENKEVEEKNKNIKLEQERLEKERLELVDKKKVAEDDYKESKEKLNVVISNIEVEVKKQKSLEEETKRMENDFKIKKNYLQLDFDNKENQLEKKIIKLENKKKIKKEINKDVELSIMNLSSENKNLTKTVNSNIKTIEDQILVIGNNDIEIIKRDKLLRNTENANKSARSLLEAINKEKANKENEIRSYKNKLIGFEKDKEEQDKELLKNRELNLALLSKEKKISRLASQIKGAYERAGIPLPFPI